MNISTDYTEPSPAEKRKKIEIFFSSILILAGPCQYSILANSILAILFASTPAYCLSLNVSVSSTLFFSLSLSLFPFLPLVFIERIFLSLFGTVSARCAVHGTPTKAQQPGALFAWALKDVWRNLVKISQGVSVLMRNAHLLLTCRLTPWRQWAVSCVAVMTPPTLVSFTNDPSAICCVQSLIYLRPDSKKL